MPLTFDIEPRFISGTTGQRLQVNPDDFLDGTTWELLEAGGTGQINVALARLYDVLLGVGGGDLVEIWARNADGTETLRVRGVVTVPDPTLDLRERHGITAYGRMEDMNHVLLDKVIVHPGGGDLAAFAAEIADDYAARRPGLVFVRDIQTTGVALETLTLSNTTARAAMDQLQGQAGRNAVWGWDIDPATNLDRFYLRPRAQAVGRQWFVGDRVKVLSSPLDHTNICNGMKLQGGPAKYPQLITNPSFELPAIPNEATGALLIDGGFEHGLGWTEVGGASRNKYDPSSNVNSSAHSGQWYAILNNPGEEMWQEVLVTPGVQYNASLFAARESGTYANVGSLILEGRSSSGTVVETYSLPITPLTTGWTGGQGTTILSGDGRALSVTFLDPGITKARIRIKTTNGSYTRGLLIDDVVFAVAGALGQTGWSTHLQNPGSGANKFVWLDWACRGAAFEGVYGLRASIVADTGNRPALAPFPGDNAGAQGYHYKPSAQQGLFHSAQVRMAPGLNSAAGLLRLEYREWAGDGHETQHFFAPDVSIPNDGAWHSLTMTTTAHGDVASATTQLAFAGNGVYDIDGVSVRDSAAAQTEFLRGANFEKYVTAESVCTSGSGLDVSAAASATNYGRRETVVSNKDILNWNADSIAYCAAYFQRNAVPLRRDRVELTHEHEQTPAPGEGTQVRISGVASPDITDWPARVSYTWSKGTLAVSMELSNERPTVAKLLRARTAGGGGSGGGGASSIAAVASTGGGTTTPPGTPVAHAATHALAGSDAVALDASQITTGVLASARLPAATAVATGAVKPGTGLSVAADGTLTATGTTGPTGPAGPAGPTGAAGSAATVAVGTTTTLAAGASATVTNSGTSSAAVLNFGIPASAAGSGGGGTSLSGLLTISLLTGYAPSATGGDAFEFILPYSASGGSITWSLDNFTETLGTAASSGNTSIIFEKSTIAGVFTAATTTSTYTVGAGATSLTQTGITGFTANSGDKIRVNITSIGIGAANLTLVAGFTCGSGQRILVVPHSVAGAITTGGDTYQAIMPASPVGALGPYKLVGYGWRQAQSGAVATSLLIETSAGGGTFTAQSVTGSITMSASSYETIGRVGSSPPTAVQVGAGDQVRINVSALGNGAYHSFYTVWSY